MLNKTTFRGLDLTRAHFVRTFFRDEIFQAEYREKILFVTISLVHGNFTNADYEDLFGKKTRTVRNDWKEDRQSVFETQAIAIAKIIQLTPRFAFLY